MDLLKVKLMLEIFLSDLEIDKCCNFLETEKKELYLLDLNKTSMTLRLFYENSSYFISDNQRYKILFFINPINKRKNIIFLDSKTNKAVYQLASSSNEKQNFDVNINEKYKRHIDNLFNVRDKKYNLNLNKGILFYGEPGNGKTVLLRYAAKLATEYGFSFGFFKTRDLSEPFMFEYKVILIDDVDTACLEKEGPAYQTLLSEFDSFTNEEKIFVLTTNNNIDNISKAFLRPGRISKCVQVDKPSPNDRFDYFSDLPFDINLLVEKTEGFSFAESALLKAYLIDTNFNLDEALYMFNTRIEKKPEKKVGFI